MSAHRLLRPMSTLVLVWCALPGIAASAASSAAQARFEHPFAVDSPWNLRPIAPVLGQLVVPESKYVPMIENTTLSTGVYLARSSDPQQVITPCPGKPGVYDADREAMLTELVIPRWPNDAFPATGGDGHAEIVDPAMDVIHSFWQLRRTGTGWCAIHYGWSKLSGRGWGDPAHYHQGARAAGVPSMAGLIRKHEVEDESPFYRHALAMSLDVDTGMGHKPLYVYPATSTDTSAKVTHRGDIPMGTLMMLPATFDSTKLRTAPLRKIAETLKLYGAYVVDSNRGTPFVIYAEIGSKLDLHQGGWNNAAANDLQAIRAGLRNVVATSGWTDDKGRKVKPQASAFNLLSLRGPWFLTRGSKAGTYDSFGQALTFPKTTSPVEMQAISHNGFLRVDWAKPQPGDRYRFSVKAQGGATLKMQIDGCNGKAVESNKLGNQAYFDFAWPDQLCSIRLIANSGEDSLPSSIEATLIQLP